MLRRSRFVAAIVALISMLFMQLAVAAYACPAQEISQAIETVQAMADMPDCSEMDAEQPNLCQAHEQAGNQSLDKPSLPDITALSTGILAVALYVIEHEGDTAFKPISPPNLAKSTSPPVAIRNCCFRI